mgnify:CR=1 FL=1
MKDQVLQPVSTNVQITIPQEHTVPVYDTTISPYISGKPMVYLQPRVKLPNLLEMLDDEWEPPFQLSLPGHKNGKLPGYKIGHNVSNGNKEQFKPDVSYVGER